MRAGTTIVAEGEMITIDGTTGEVYARRAPDDRAALRGRARLRELLGWADETRRLRRPRQCRHPRDARARARVRRAGHRSVPHRAHVLRGAAADRAAMILRPCSLGRRRCRTSREDASVATCDARSLPLAALQTGDFVGIFRAMDGPPVTIRLIDPPLHEFLPDHDELLEEVTRAAQRRQTRRGGARRGRASCCASVEACASRTRCWACAAAASASLYPEIVEMQVAAILGAASQLASRGPATPGDHDPARRPRRTS